MRMSYDFVIVGTGIIGLTVGQELRRRYPSSSIAFLEKESDIGMHASGRNSGVMHSGVYYGTTTLKAKMCASGAARMRLFAEEHGIKFSRNGKVIIATSEQELSTIDRLLANAKANNIRADRLDSTQISRIEPHASVHKAGIFCPDTSVIDSNGVIYKIRELLERSKVKFFFGAAIKDVSVVKKKICTLNGDFSFGFLFNCAGAGADIVAKLFGHSKDYSLIPFKGIYYKLRSEKRYLVQGNIYPVPDIDLPFLGVHLTRVVNGDVYVGPTAIPALGRENYGILQGIKLDEGLVISGQLFSMYKANNDNFRRLVHAEIKKYYKPFFVGAAKKLVSELKNKDFLPSSKVGIRPQLVNVKTRRLEMDYIVEKDAKSLHVLNAISPAFTSSFAFSEWLVTEAEQSTGR